MCIGLMSHALLFSQTLVSEGKEAWASTAGAGANRNAAAGNDGNVESTRWESESSDPQWWAVDLGKEYYIPRVEIDWETAASREYKIQISNDRNFDTFTDIAHMVDMPNAQGGHRIDNIQGSLMEKGRYLRVYGISRNTGYGHSFYECRVYGQEQVVPTTVKLNVPYVQYMKVQVTPADLDGKRILEIQNKDEVIDLRYNIGTPLKIEMTDFRGNYYVDFWAYEEGSTTESIRSDIAEGIPFVATVYDGMEVNVELTEKLVVPGPPAADAGPNVTIEAPQNSVELDGSRSQDRTGEIVSYMWRQLGGPNQANIETPNQVKTMVSGLILGDYRFELSVTNDRGLIGTNSVVVSVKPPEVVDFQLTSPANKTMITDTRKPTLRWNVCPGATKYEIFVNITRDDYEWYASGNLLDRYTKVGESTTNSFTLANDLVDRWTYKWYVVATTPDGTKYSDKLQFGLYLPVLEQEDDGVNIVNGCRDMNKNGTIEPFEDWHNTPEVRLADLMSRLNDNEKARQLFYEGRKVVEEGFQFNSGNISEMKKNQMNTARNARMGIPVATLGDNTHGFKTAYPTGIGMAAMQDMDMVYRLGNMQRIEQRNGGHTGTLGPIAEVGTKALYPRYQEGCGDDADAGAALIRAMVCGMQGGPEINPTSILVTVKHWPSQGAGGEGPTQYDDVTIKYHMKPWHAAVDANAASVMPGYGSSPYLDPSGASACDSKPTIDYLRKDIGFKGFVVTDWLPASTKVSVTSISAGCDVMGGAGMEGGETTVLADLIAGVGMDRLNEAAARVLDVKIRLGMFENPYAYTTSAFKDATQQKEHYDLVVEAARKSVTLLTNKNEVLPLRLNAGDEIVVGSPKDENGDSYLIDPPNRPSNPHLIWHTVYSDNALDKYHYGAIVERATKDGVKVYMDEAPNAKVAIVVIGEKSYTHGQEWGTAADKQIDVPEEQVKIIRDFKAQGLKVVTVVISPRPYVLTDVVEISDAVMLVYRGGNGIAQATAECIFGDFAPTGKLPYQLPRSKSQVGTDNTNDQKEKWDLPYDMGATDFERQQIRNLIEQDLPVPPLFGDPLFQAGSGMQGFISAADDTPPTAFDLTAPDDDAISTSPSVTFTWQASTDPESSIAYYEIYIDDVKKANPTTTSYTTTIAESGVHSWYVNAVNSYGLSTRSTTTRNFEIKTSAVQINEMDEIKVYPNPFKDELTVESGNLKLENVEILDITGKTLFTVHCSPFTNSINVSHLPAGIYFLRAIGEKHIETIKIIK